MRRFCLLLSMLVACGPTEDTPIDTDPDTVCTDADGDGYCAETDDCDDANMYVYPGDGNDVPYNGTDEDCDGEDLVDVDGDGHAGKPAGGADCNDGNPEVNPDAEEVCYQSSIDYDCDGTYLIDDCDQDGFPKAEDCGDMDPEMYPGNVETWYDGKDGDCDRHSDFDQDYDGDDHVDHGGGDCDDLDPDRSSLIDEAWDGIDGDCNGVIDDLTTTGAWKDYDGSYLDYSWTNTVVTISDYDGDGLPEVFASDLAKRDANGDPFQGGAYLISTGEIEGRTDEVEISEFSGSGSAETFGWSADRAGDLDGDGLDDILVGSPFYDQGTGDIGATLLFLGSDIRLNGSMTSTTAHAELYGMPYAGLMSAGVDDLDGDGVQELVSATDTWALLGIAVYSGAEVVAGGTFTTADAIATVESVGALGGAVVGKFDLDQDGTNDFLLGRTTPDFLCGGACSGTSRVYVVSGDVMAAGGSIALPDHAYIDGPTEGGLGATAGVLNDITGDGYPEAVIADPFTLAADGTTYGGTVYVVDGDEILDGEDVEAQAMATVQSSIGNMFLRVNRRFGDHDGDGKHDLLVGSPGQIDVYSAISGSFATSGPGYVYYYSSEQLAAGGTFDESDAKASFRSQMTGSSFGMAFDVGDYDADGDADVAVGAPLFGYGKLFLFTPTL